jgi:hypothetical protein
MHLAHRKTEAHMTNEWLSIDSFRQLRGQWFDVRVTTASHVLDARLQLRAVVQIVDGETHDHDEPEPFSAVFMGSIDSPLPVGVAEISQGGESFEAFLQPIGASSDGMRYEVIVG